MHIDDSDISFFVRLPAERVYYGRLDHYTAMFRLLLEIQVQRRIDPISVLRDCNLAVVGRNGLRDSLK